MSWSSIGAPSEWGVGVLGIQGMARKALVVSTPCTLRHVCVPSRTEPIVTTCLRLLSNIAYDDECCLALMSVVPAVLNALTQAGQGAEVVEEAVAVLWNLASLQVGVVCIGGCSRRGLSGRGWGEVRAPSTRPRR